MVSVTRLGLVSKFDGKRALCYVQDLVDRRPVSGARVDVYYSGEVVRSGRTGSDGVFATTIPNDAHQFLQSLPTRDPRRSPTTPAGNAEWWHASAIPTR